MKPFNFEEKMSSGSFKNVIIEMCLEIIYIIFMYIYICVCVCVCVCIKKI